MSMGALSGGAAAGAINYEKPGGLKYEGCTGRIRVDRGFNYRARRALSNARFGSSLSGVVGIGVAGEHVADEF